MKKKEDEPMNDPVFNLAVIGIGLYILFAANVLAGILIAGVGVMNYLRCMEAKKKEEAKDSGF